MKPFYEAIAWLVVHIHTVLADVFGSQSAWAWALSIVFLTIAMRLVLFPLFVKQIKNQRAMQVLQPKMKELQAKYKNDKEKLNQEMMALWKEHGRADYPLLYQEKIDAGPVETFHVEVRGGKVSVWRCEGDEKTKLKELTPSQRQAYTVSGLFERMERFLIEDQAASQRNYVTAVFDARDGHPTHYVRRVSGTQQRLEWVIKMLPVHE